MKIQIKQTKEIEVTTPLFLEYKSLNYNDYVKFDGKKIYVITVSYNGEITFTYRQKYMNPIIDIKVFLETDYILSNEETFNNAKNKLTNKLKEI